MHALGQARGIEICPDGRLADAVELFDSHLHLDDAAFDADRPAAVARARAAGVIMMVTVGTDPASWRQAVALTETFEEIYAALAVHPHDAGRAVPEAVDALRLLAERPKVVAIGETGLDFARHLSARDAQEAAFRAQVRLARDLDLPVIIHCREAYPEVLEILAAERAGPVVMHAFSGSVEVARRCADLGYMISLAGPVTFRNARTPLAVAREVPLPQLLIETDAPVLAPEPHRGRRNEPAYLTHIAERIAELRGVPVEEIASATAANARRVYRVDAN